MEPKSILEHITEHDVVTVHNPLSDTFPAKVARSVVAPAQRRVNPTGNGAADAFMQGLNAGITQGGHMSMQHVQQTIELKPGQTIRMPGDVARVVVRQLVKEMMQRMGDKKRMADPAAIMEYERKVVLNHESMLSNISVESAEERLKRQLDELNKQETVVGAEDEPAFPTELDNGAGAAAGDSQGTSRSASQSAKRTGAKAN